MFFKNILSLIFCALDFNKKDGSRWLSIGVLWYQQYDNFFKQAVVSQTDMPFTDLYRFKFPIQSGGKPCLKISSLNFSMHLIFCLAVVVIDADKSALGKR